jgi:hypothetical protein
MRSSRRKEAHLCPRKRNALIRVRFVKFVSHSAESPGLSLSHFANVSIVSSDGHDSMHTIRPLRLRRGCVSLRYSTTTYATEPANALQFIMRGIGPRFIFPATLAKPILFPRPLPSLATVPTVAETVRAIFKNTHFSWGFRQFAIVATVATPSGEDMCYGFCSPSQPPPRGG